MLATFLLLGMAAQSAAHSGEPLSPVFRVGREAVDAIRSSRPEAIEQFLSRWLAPPLRPDAPSLARLLRRLREQGGALTVRDSSLDGSAVTYTLWSPSLRRGVTLLIATGERDTTRITHLFIARRLIEDGNAGPIVADRPGDAATASAIRHEIRRLARADVFSGVVLVARGDSVLVEEAVGMANREAGEPVTLRTRFHHASTGKMFTAVAIARLFEAGRVSLDDSMGTLLPDIPWATASRGITVRQLLSHSSGLGMLFDRPSYDRARGYRTATEQLALFAGHAPSFAPGSRFAYSNEGYEVLGAIIERVTGRPYAAHVRDEILARAGMTDTDAWARTEPLDDRATDYAVSPDDPFGLEPRRSKADMLGIRGSAAGGFYGTARDLFRFMRAVTSGKLVAHATLREFLSPGGLGMRRADESYGFGFITTRLGDQTWFGHGGGGAGIGICNDVMARVDGSWIVVVMSNYEPPMCEDLAREIARFVAAR